MPTYWNYIPKRFLGADFSSFQPQTKAQEEALSELQKGALLSNNVILTGSCGTGKTHLCFALLKSLAQKRYQQGDPFCPSDSVLFVSIKDLLSEIKETFSGNPPPDHLYQKAIEAPLLIIDEIGLQYGTKMERQELFRLFNERYNMMRPTIGVSNLPPKELKNLLGQRIYDRLFSNAKVFEFIAPSYRNAYPTS